MSEIKTTEALCNLVTSLGGPKLDPEELEWALDLPAGRAMLDWLIDQLQHGCIAPSISGDAYLTEGDILRATIKNIALESEELKIMQTIDILQYNSDHRMTCASPGVYVTPSVLHERATFSEEEARLFDNETQNLKRRLKQYELMSRDFKRRMESLRLQIHNDSTEISTLEEMLHECSIQADACTLKSKGTANRLLDAFTARLGSAGDNPEGIGLLYARRKDLDRFASIRDTIVHEIERSLQEIEAKERSLSTPRDLQEEAARLHKLLATFDSQKGPLNMGSAYCSELDAISEVLERGVRSKDKAHTINHILAELSSDAADDVPPSNPVGIVDELGRAWNLDQAALLSAREQILDFTLERFEDLVPGIFGLHGQLAAAMNLSVESEASIIALIEELGDVLNDAECAQRAAKTTSRPTEREQALEQSLSDVLKESQAYRCPDAGPLVLLDSEDIGNEVKDAFDQLHNVKRDDDKWARDLPSQLDRLAEQHMPSLSCVYAKSPVNTSAPFGPPEEVVELEKDAQARVRGMAGEIDRLRKATEWSSRETRKVTAFVEDWSGRM